MRCSSAHDSSAASEDAGMPECRSARIPGRRRAAARTPCRRPRSAPWSVIWSSTSSRRRSEERSSSEESRRSCRVVLLAHALLEDAQPPVRESRCPGADGELCDRERRRPRRGRAPAAAGPPTPASAVPAAASAKAARLWVLRAVVQRTSKSHHGSPWAPHTGCATRAGGSPNSCGDRRQQPLGVGAVVAVVADAGRCRCSACARVRGHGRAHPAGAPS